MAERRTIRHRLPRARRGRGRDDRRARRRPGRARRAADLRAAALLRGAAARPLVPRGARHHRPHLRHLPGRLPDERRQRDREPLRRRGARADPDAAPPPLLRRVDREPRAARLHAPRARLPRLRERGRARPRRARRRRARARAQEDRQRRDDARRRPRDPPDQRARRRLLPRADAGASCARSSSRSSARARRRSRRCAGRPGFDFPERVGRLRARRARRSRASTRSSAAGSSPSAGLDLAPAEYDEHFEELHVERSNALHSQLRERRHVPLRPARALLARLRPALAARARGGARRRASGHECRDPFRSIVVRSVELVHACDESLRLIEAYEEPDAPGRARSSRSPAPATA